jgi:hypothetical protein
MWHMKWIRIEARNFKKFRLFVEQLAEYWKWKQEKICLAVWQWGIQNDEQGWKQIIGSRNYFFESGRRVYKTGSYYEWRHYIEIRGGINNARGNTLQTRLEITHRKNGVRKNVDPAASPGKDGWKRLSLIHGGERTRGRRCVHIQVLILKFT